MRTSQIFLIALFAVIFASLVFASEPSEIFALNTETAHEVSYTTTISDIQITKPVPVDGYPALKARIAYPEFARTSKIDGNLLVKAYIDENGQVQSISKVKGNDEPGFKDAVQSVLLDTKWKPATFNGKAMPSYLEIAFRFRLSD